MRDGIFFDFCELWGFATCFCAVVLFELLDLVVILLLFLLIDMSKRSFPPLSLTSFQYKYGFLSFYFPLIETNISLYIQRIS